MVRTLVHWSERRIFKYLRTCRCFAVSLIKYKRMLVIWGFNWGMNAEIYLQANRHDDIRFTLLGLIRLDARVNELYKLIKNSL